MFIVRRYQADDVLMQMIQVFLLFFGASNYFKLVRNLIYETNTFHSHTLHAHAVVTFDCVIIN